MNWCGFLLGLDIQHLDHLAPLCLFLRIPLLFTDVKVYELAKTYYPRLESRLLPSESFANEIIHEYNVIFTCLPRQIVEVIFFLAKQLSGKDILSVWVPHGNSDKDNLGALTHERIYLVYGEQMAKKLSHVYSNNLSISPKGEAVVVGNLKRHVYLSDSNTFSGVLKKKLTFARRGRRKTILYAPTWDDVNVSSELFSLLEKLPDEYNLYVKLHPNTLVKEGGYPSIRERFGDRGNIIFLDDIPNIYPILERADIYVGGNSSIAYDFLSFKRPLFFTSTGDHEIYSAGCRVTIDRLFMEMRGEVTSLVDRRQNLYAYAFQGDVDYKQLPNQIEKAIVSAAEFFI